MQSVEIRAARPGDAAAVAAYHDRCVRSTFAAQIVTGATTAPDVRDTLRQLHERFVPESGFATQVAAIDGQPIGHVTVCGHHLVHLFVAPDHQGRGVGRHLLEQGEAMIADMGHERFELHVRVDNPAAIAFYERAGWEHCGRVIHTVEHGIGYDEHILVKANQLTN